ncbi:tetratricopeptide repeat protein [Candidatus Woesearchaeota archaeon]|nr:tetratricopeptide repeat protein [Candidatus Woesearchaeota archaeon]
MNKKLCILLIFLLILSACKTVITQQEPQLTEEQKAEKITQLLLEARYFTEQGDFTNTITKLSEVLKLDTNNIDAHLNLGLVYGFIGDLEQAKKEINRVLIIDPSNPNAIELKKILEGQATLNPESKNEEAMKYFSKAEEYFGQGKYELAISEYQKAIAADPEFSTAYLYLGDTYYKLNKYDDAIQQYSEAIKKDPKNKRPYHYLGDAYLAKNNVEKAIENYQKALEIDPDYTIVQAKLADLQKK